MASFCFQRGIQQRFAAPGAQWMDGTAERTLRTIGEMALTTLIHSGLPKTMWGYATLHAIEVINRTAESARSNKLQGFDKNLNFSRLERWRNKSIQDQAKNLYPFGCLAFKFVYPELRGKLDAHSTPSVFLGLDAKSRCYKLGSLFDLVVSIAVEVSFVEEVFPFRFAKPSSPYHHLWSTESSLREGDQNFDSSLLQNPLYTPPTTKELLKQVAMVPGTKFSSGADSQAAGDGGKVVPVTTKTPRRVYGARARPKAAHIDPDIAPHAAILAKKQLSTLPVVPEERFWPYADLGEQAKQNQLLPPSDFRARVVTAGDPPSAHAATLVQAAEDLPTGRRPFHFMPEDVLQVHKEILAENPPVRPSNDRLLSSHAFFSSAGNSWPMPDAPQFQHCSTDSELLRHQNLLDINQDAIKQLLTKNLASECAPTAPDTAVPRPHSHSVSLVECDTLLLTESQVLDTTPKTAREALSCPASASWLIAMNREKACHEKNRTFGQSCAIPSDVKPIPADWIFKIKHRGEIDDLLSLTQQQYKARIILRGQFMKPGLDFNDAFSPVAKNTTIRAVLAVATKYDMHLFSGDVETAFLTPDIDTEIWVTMPPFYGQDGVQIDGGSSGARTVRKLLKGVPGIPQGGKLFYDKFSAYLIQCGFNQSAADKCLFFRGRDDQFQLCVVWVDDFLFACFDSTCWEALLAQLKAQFNITGGELRQFLGLEITRNRSQRQMSITQASVAKSLLDKFGLSEANPVPTPCPAGFIFTKTDSPASLEKKICLRKRERGQPIFGSEALLLIFCLAGPDLTSPSLSTSSPSSCPTLEPCTGLD